MKHLQTLSHAIERGRTCASCLVLSMSCFKHHASHRVTALTVRYSTRVYWLLIPIRGCCAATLMTYNVFNTGACAVQAAACFWKHSRGADQPTRGPQQVRHATCSSPRGSFPRPQPCPDFLTHPGEGYRLQSMDRHAEPHRDCSQEGEVCPGFVALTLLYSP